MMEAVRDLWPGGAVDAIHGSGRAVAPPKPGGHRWGPGAEGARATQRRFSVPPRAAPKRGDD
jgi:hypothetical protein